MSQLSEGLRLDDKCEQINCAIKRGSDAGSCGPLTCRLATDKVVSESASPRAHDVPSSVRLLHCHRRRQWKVEGATWGAGNL